MVTPMRIKMQNILGNRSEILAGAINGQKAVTNMLEQINDEPEKPEELFLDFSDVQVATASFLREAVFAFREKVRGRRSNFYPVVANANLEVEDELRVLVQSDNSVLMLCVLDRKGRPHKARLVGSLDPKQRLTFDLVQKGVTDAGQLMREHRENEKVKQTAWNNRLAALTALGLVVEMNAGRTKKYRPLFGEA
jgi:uncharacterized protein (DUF58 family)